MNIKREGRVDFFSCWLPLLLGLIITLLTAWWLNYQNEYEAKLYTYNLAEKTESLIKQRFQHFEYGLRGVRGAISAVGVDQITRVQFESYNLSRDIDMEFPGSLGFGFIRRVPLEQERNFIDKAIKDSAPNFSVRTLTSHNNDRFIIQYIYPLEKNKQAVGLDIGSESNRRSAALSAAKDNRPYLTAPITLVQANKKSRKGALVLLPIYPDNVPLSTEQARTQAVLGWSYAPLVIDDVLDSLELQIDQAYVMLTNTEDNEPFYYSNDSVESISLQYKTVRNIHVLGQNWILNLAPSMEVIKQIKPWRIDWVVLFGLGLTFCTMFVINILRSNQLAEEKNNKIYQLSFQSLLAFLRSTQFKRSTPFVFVLFFLIFLTSGWLIIQSHFTEVSHNLSKIKNSALFVLNKEATQYSQDVLFLASTPVIQDLRGLRINNNDLEKSKAVQQLNERLANIFKAYMLSKLDVHQVRFIGASNDWRERVKVQRFGDELRTFSAGLLQSKNIEPYVDQTIKLGVGHVFSSDINLNREFETIEKPDRPVWRFSTPLFYSDGSPFGIIIVNVSARNILKATAGGITKATDLYLTNARGDYLLNPKVSKEFSFEYKDSPRWQDEFESVDLFYGLKSFDLKSYEGEQGRIFVNQGVFGLDEKTEGRELKIYSTTSEFLVFQAIAIKVLGVVIALFLVIFISIIIQYWVWLSDIIRHRDGLKSQIEIQRNKEILRFKGLLESAPDATFVVNELGTIQMVNVQAEAMFGYARVELEGQLVAKLIPEHLRDAYTVRILEYMNDSKTAGIKSGVELLALGADGEEFPVEISLSSVNLDEKIMISASVRNISERLTAEEKLRKALRDAELATEAKSAFLANTSHEIRTPLNAIIGLGYLLSEEKLTEAQQQLVSKIQISGKSLLGIVNDVLDLAKIEANEMTLEERPLDLRELIEEVSGVFSVQAEAKDLELNVHMDSKLPSWVIADSIRLRQILSNLLGNALKFTTMGNVSIHADILDEVAALPENHVAVRISIMDTGIGISTEAQERLFKPFTQADSSTTRRFGGTGLGLSIVHQLVQMMGGKMGVESRENKGSKFWLDLLFKVQTVEEIAAQDYQKQTLFVLIAEDDPADAKQLQKMTRALGWRSEVVSNGDELVNAYLARQEHKLRPPDAMIVDWQMPIMDGLDAISALANRIGRKNLPAVLMVSSHDQETIIQHNTANLVNNFIMKPVNSSALFNAVNEVVTLTTGNSKRVMQSTHTPAVAAKWLPEVHVLVVDDSPINLVVVSHMLEHNGALVQTANSGEEAISLLADSSNNFDAVLMDVQMPGIDGLETTRRIRNQLEKLSLPIIALTAGALLEEKTRALEAGMNDFLTKPINPSKLINVLRTLVETYRGKSLAIESLDSAVAENDVWPEVTGLNLTKAKSLLLGDKQLFLSTLDGLLTQHENLAQSPIKNIDGPEEKDLRLQLASQVHKLRSASGMIGAEKIQRYAADAEKILRAKNQPVEGILVALSIAMQELQQASTEILNAWQKAKSDELTIKIATQEESSLLKVEKVQEILILLNEHDLEALEKVEEYSMSLLGALGETDFKEFQKCLENLNYKEATRLLEPLIKTLGEV